MENNKNFYVTTPIYYASGKPHLGNSYPSIAADVIARWNRNLGKNVFFITGTDEHGQKIKKKAEEKKITPKEFVDSLLPEFTKLNSKLNLSNDFFIRTTNPKHKKIVQKYLQIAYDNKDIYKSSYEGLYCVDCEQYYKETDLDDDNKCPIHKKKVLYMKEEAYFFKLSKYQNKLLKLYEKNETFLSPKNKAQETINRVKEGLQDVCISRNKNTLDWGIELPFDKEHVVYVWFDALFSYLSSLEINKNKNEFWPANVHILGKDIMWFHTVYWPAFLMSVKEKIPEKIFSHGWWIANGEKMGKSIGNIINPIEYIDKYGTDEFRFFLLYVGTFGEDLDFSKEKFIEKINNELNNDLGNLISRVHTMITKYFEGTIPTKEKLEKIDFEFIEKLNIFEKFNKQIQNLEFNQSLDTLFRIIRETNSYINLTSPWKEKDKNRLKTIINILTSSVFLISKYLNPFMPEKSELIFKQFNLKNNKKFEFEFIINKIKINEKENLFQKIKIENKEENNFKQNLKNNLKKKIENKIKKLNFSDLNLKVGKIISIKQHPEADKLYVEEIDIGEKVPRTIVSGLKNHYNLEDLKNKKVVVLINLKPIKLRGIKSNGMVLVSENEEEKQIGILTSKAKIGTNLKCNDIIANNKSNIKIDDFFKIKIESDGNKIYFENNEVFADKDKIQIDKKIKGIIC